MYLRCELLRGKPVVPNHTVGNRKPQGAGGLRADDLTNLNFGQSATPDYPLNLGLLMTVHDKNVLQSTSPVSRFGKQGDVKKNAAVAETHEFALLPSGFVQYQRVNNTLQSLTRLRLAEYPRPDRRPVHPSGSIDGRIPKRFPDGRYGRATRSCDRLGNGVSINNRGAGFGKKATHSRFSAANSTGQSHAPEGSGHVSPTR